MTKFFWNVLVLIAISVLIPIFLWVRNYPSFARGITLEKVNTTTHQSYTQPILQRSPQSNVLAQVTSVEGIGDVSPSDPYYSALRNIIERYGVDVSFFDKTFKGNQSLTRGNFVVYLVDSLKQIFRIIASPTGDVSLLANNVERITAELSYGRRSVDDELVQIKKRLNDLEQKLDKY